MSEKILQTCPFCGNIIKIVTGKLEKLLNKKDIDAEGINTINEVIKILEMM